MYTRDEILSYRCPRWNDWPNLGLYMDQVISLLEEQVTGFYPDDQPKPVTSTMINNYVKQKIVMPSQNKKYKREHLAYLYVVFLLKPVLSLTDICDSIVFLTKDKDSASSYDSFCGEIEAAIATAFGGGTPEACTDCSEITRAISLAFSYTMFARLCLNDVKPVRS